MALTDEEENRPRRRKVLEPPRFDGWDLAQLQDYIAELRAEIARAEAAIDAGAAQRAAAEALFRRP
ncbi:DUF1192 family protein [Roseomonas eburnea]|uniref:DUF1192 family protein n=1 Tax=Neoroseomonas eburnea TaxID=1346889 RepID=A0A9X9XK01_9PROT|nr:DUF1192 family protein [Neoroseomonas eburnea]MBR0684037.1 DUF1192 family protein [Neoroseomonas eburnea]